jgi:hypothetical protein
MRGQSLYPTEVVADDRDQLPKPIDSVDVEKSLQETIQKNDDETLQSK